MESIIDQNSFINDIERLRMFSNRVANADLNKYSILNMDDVKTPVRYEQNNVSYF